MAEPYLGEIRMFSFAFAPRGWGFADGRVLPVNQNQALWSALGNSFGGDGHSTFALPDLRGRAAMCPDDAHPVGYKDGEETHTLSVPEMPEHTHRLMAANESGTGVTPVDAIFAATPNQLYHASDNEVVLNTGTVGPVGGSQPHQNMMPYLTVSFCIALQGVMPPL